MKMRFILAFLAIVALSILISSLILTHKKSGHVILLKGALVDTSQVNADVLEHEIRSSLPPGTSLTAVEDFLSEHKIEFSLDRSSNTIYAAVRDIKGSSLIIRTDLGVQFHFNDNSNLKSIDVTPKYTGP